MKRYLIMMLFVLPMYVVGQTLEAGFLPSEIQVVPGNKQALYYLIFEGKGEQKVNISLIDQKEQTLFTKFLKSSDGFIQPVNMKQLPVGVYTFRVSTGNQEYQKQIYLNPADAIKTQLTEAETGKYTLAISKRVLDPISVSIYDDEQHLLYQKEWNFTETNLDQTYSFEEIESSHVTFVVSTSNGIVSEETVSLKK